MHILIFPSKIWAKSAHYTQQNMVKFPRNEFSEIKNANEIMALASELLAFLLGCREKMGRKTRTHIVQPLCLVVGQLCFILIIMVIAY